MNKLLEVVLPCGSTNEPAGVLEAKGWQLLCSFDAREPAQVQMARDRIVWTQGLRNYQVVRVNGHQASKGNESIVYLYVHTRCEVFPRLDGWYNRNE